MGKTFVMPAGMRGDAVFSSGNPPQFRHVLRRWWHAQKSVHLVKPIMFIGHNPSDAGRHSNDPTILKVCKYALAWGFNDVLMHNLMDRISDDPDYLYWLATNNQPVMSERNTLRMIDAASSVEMIVCAWGEVRKPFQNIADGVESALRVHGYNLHVLDFNKDGSPKHPLYCSDELRPKEWGDIG